MRKTTFIKLTSLAVASTIYFSGIATFASETKVVETKTTSIITPFFIAIVRASSNLTLNSGGILTCQGKTEVQTGYIAGTTVELQQYNGGWVTIDSWSGSANKFFNITNNRAVYSGYQYRVKTTHKALNSSGTTIESTITYSSTISY